jgi:hypothetical protein
MPIASLSKQPAKDVYVAIARRRPATLDAIAAPMPTAPPAPRLDVPVPLGNVPASEVVTPVGRLRRCTFRRIDRVSALPGRQDASAYEVMCLFGDRDEPMALGDIEMARPLCDTCTASGIFRPDED